MKNTNLLTQKFLSGAVALAVVALATVASAEDVRQVVTVAKIEGQARFSVDNKNWKTLHRGDVLKPGSVIQTAEASTVDIMMGEPASTQQGLKAPPPVSLNGINTLGNPPVGASDGSSSKANLVRIFPSSVLAIDKLVLQKTGADDVSETQLDLRAGQILGNVKKLSAASRYEVKIPNGVAGIRGTVYMVSATGVVYVLEGQVIISYVNASGQLVTATVTAGNNFNPFQGSNGTTTPTPPATNAALLAQVEALNGNTQTPSTTVTKNNTVINISAN
jgi:hypothetical protein